MSQSKFYFSQTVHSYKRNTSFHLGELCQCSSEWTLALFHQLCLGGTMTLINASEESGVDDWMTCLQIHRSRAHGSLMVP